LSDKKRLINAAFLLHLTVQTEQKLKDFTKCAWLC